MSEEEYIKLYEKFLSGECTPEELRIIEKYNEDGFDLLNEPWDSQVFGDQERIKKKIKTGIRTGMESSPPIKRMVAGVWYKIAAVLAIFTLISIYFIPSFLNDEERRKDNNTSSRFEKTNVTSATEVSDITLLLSDGSTIQLEDKDDGVLSVLNGISVIKEKQKLIFQFSNTVLTNRENNSIYKLTVPYGDQYQVVLTDGTEIWLNSGSDISFAVPFNETSRDVIINGEAYFEVAHEGDRPFVVLASNTQIDVLGTHFNIKAYGDESRIHTTLFEGSVQVTKDSQNVILKPGQKSITSEADDKIVVEKADLREILAWKSDVFIFNNTSVSEIMKQISRLYDVEIEFRNDTENLKITGEFSRFQEVEKVLEMLELTGVVKFKIDGRRVIVMT